MGRSQRVGKVFWGYRKDELGGYGGWVDAGKTLLVGWEGFHVGWISFQDRILGSRIPAGEPHSEPDPVLESNL